MLTKEVTGDAAVALQVGHHHRAVEVVPVGCTASWETRWRRSVSPSSSQRVRGRQPTPAQMALEWRRGLLCTCVWRTDRIRAGERANQIGIEAQRGDLEDTTPRTVRIRNRSTYESKEICPRGNNTFIIYFCNS